MSKLKTALLTVLSTAVLASPVYAGVPVWNFAWAFSGCGGTEFETCISGSVYTSDDLHSIRVSITNVGPGTMTAVGLWNLPEVGGVAVLPTSGTTNAPGNWGVPSQDINGVVSPSQHRYAIGTTDGINSGIAAGGGPYLFDFNFASTVDVTAFVDDIGVGAHMQGLATCSSKVYLLSDGEGGSTESNPFQGPDNCTSVPEPGSLFLLGSGAAGMAFVASRRRKGIDLVDEDGNDVEI